MNLVGRTIGASRILKEPGRGGVAMVYRAYQPSLNRHVTIKVLPPHLSFDQEFVERSQREVRAAASLRHPNIWVAPSFGSKPSKGSTWTSQGSLAVGQGTTTGR